MKQLRSRYSNFVADFIPISFEHFGEPYENVFAQLRNNKTVAQTVGCSHYHSLGDIVRQEYAGEMELLLGRFLLGLKHRNDNFYKRCLNRDGDRVYCNFRITDRNVLQSRGIYAYFVRDELKYIGRCCDTMEVRVNRGYGAIQPRKCYLDGNSTNCHLNAEILQAKSTVTLWFCRMDSIPQIKVEEGNLIETFKPPWNRRG